MNQILSTEDLNNKKKKNKGNRANTKDIKSVIKFFAIILILFGVLITANSAFAIFKGNNVANTSEQQSTEKPEIQLENKGEDQVILTVMHVNEIRDVIYYWNNEDVETISGEKRKYIQKKIEIPKGENVLNVKVTDVNGQVAEYSQNFTLKKDIDITMEQSGNNVKVKVIGTSNIKNIEYKWDNDETKTIDVNEQEYILVFFCYR